MANVDLLVGLTRLLAVPGPARRNEPVRRVIRLSNNIDRVRWFVRRSRPGPVITAAAVVGAILIFAVLLAVNWAGADSWAQAWGRTLGWPYSWFALLIYLTSLPLEPARSAGIRRVAGVLYGLFGGGLLLYLARNNEVMPYQWAEVAGDVLLVFGGAGVFTRGLSQLLLPGAPSRPAEQDGPS